MGVRFADEAEVRMEERVSVLRGEAVVRAPDYERDGARLYCGRWEDVLPSLDAGSVDAVITDPPYGLREGAAIVRRGGAVIDDGDGSWNRTDDPFAFMGEAARVVMNGGHVATFLDRSRYRECDDRARAVGLECWQMFYLVKQAPAPTPRPCFASAVEDCAIFAVVGVRRRWYGGGYTPNRWIGMTPNRLGTGSGHPSEKPVEPMLMLARALTPPGGLILDPFMGSGTTGVAAVREGRRFIGIECERRYFETAVRRIDGELKQGKLFDGGAS